MRHPAVRVVIKKVIGVVEKTGLESVGFHSGITSVILTRNASGDNKALPFVQIILGNINVNFAFGNRAVVLDLTNSVYVVRHYRFADSVGVCVHNLGDIDAKGLVITTHIALVHAAGIDGERNPGNRIVVVNRQAAA